MSAILPEPAAARASLLVVIPALNERETVGSVVASARRAAARLSEMGLALKICVVDDGSDDGTSDAAARAGADRVVRHKSNMGLGAAVRTGLNLARDEGFSAAVKIDADAQHDPSDIPALIAPLLSGDADVVYGDRFPRMAYRMPLIRRAGNIASRALMRRLAPSYEIADSAPGVFAVNAAYLSVFRIRGDYNYTQQVLLDAYLKNMRFAQVPVAFHSRASGDSFISPKYPFYVLAQLLAILAAERPLKVFLPIAALLLAAALALLLAGFAAPLGVAGVGVALALAAAGAGVGGFGLLRERARRRAR